MMTESSEQYKRNTAFKLRIGSVLAGKPIIEDERVKFIETENKKVARANIIANVTEKFVQEGEKKFGSLTLDDGTGQIRIKVFGEDIKKILDLNQGDTVLVIGLVRSWNNELYLTPEIIKKKSPEYLLIRKLESDLEAPKTLDRTKLIELKDKLMSLIKEGEKDGGIGIDKIIMELKETPEIINSEIKRLLEEGLIYEPRPGKLRYLG